MNFSKSLDLNTSTLSKGPQYIQRLKRDLDDLQNYDFSCSASNLKIEIHENSFYMNICIREGPYRNGHYLFVVLIPEKYPFRIPEVFSVRPIWHPNVEPLAGRVGLPIEWSPVLTLVSFALAIQV
jgi:ubiquitin-protein ligase